MSEPINLPDELSWKQGGENPFFYAHCMSVWASLGDLVVDTVHPHLQMQFDPSNLPIVTAFQLFTEQKIISTGEKSLCMASWVDKTTDGTGTKYTERRFLLRMQHNVKDVSGDSSDTTDYMVGRRAIVTSKMVEQSGRVQFVTRSAGITKHTAQYLAQLLVAPELWQRKKRVQDMRAEAEQRATLAASKLPSYDELLSEGRINILGRVVYLGQDVESLAEGAIIQNKIRNTMITKEEILPLDYNIRLAQSIVFLLMGTTSQS